MLMALFQAAFRLLAIHHLPIESYGRAALLLSLFNFLHLQKLSRPNCIIDCIVIFYKLINRGECVKRTTNLSFNPHVMWRFIRRACTLVKISNILKFLKIFLDHWEEYVM